LCHASQRKAEYMVTFVKGNIFDSPAQVLGNTVNTTGVMGKGIALDFKQRFPAMFEDYVKRCKQGNVQLGKPYVWEDDRVQILNFPTKSHWKSRSQLKDIETGLQYLVAHYDDWGIASMALPPLGCGNGGLRWEDVRSLIEKYLGAIPDLEVFVYEPKQAASGILRRSRSAEPKASKKLPVAARPAHLD